LLLEPKLNYEEKFKNQTLLRTNKIESLKVTYNYCFMF